MSAARSLASAAPQGTSPSPFRPESANAINDQADNQNQANSSAADGWPSKIKPAAAE
jgi:hypothetical protein